MRLMARFILMLILLNNEQFIDAIKEVAFSDRWRI